MFPIETQGAVEVVSPSVPLNTETAEKFAATLLERNYAGQPMVVLDMADIPLLDSAGLEALLKVEQSLRQAGGMLKLAAVSPLCSDILRITGLNQNFEIHHDAKAAVRSFIR